MKRFLVSLRDVITYVYYRINHVFYQLSTVFLDILLEEFFSPVIPYYLRVFNNEYTRSK